MALALIANGALLLNMARRLRFVIAQPITIVGFLLSFGLLLSCVLGMSTSHTYLLPSDSPAAPAVHHALTSAYYYAIISLVIYLQLALLMCWTVFGVYRGHFGREFNLTPVQRTLMLQTMSFVTYLLLGALVFSHLEGWHFLDAVYWADVTLLTIGLGDYTPTTHASRSLLFPFAIGGILTIGLVIGSIRSLVLESGQKKISARMMEKKRQRAVASLDTRKHRIRISRFQTIPFNESFTEAAQKREQEFRVMRSVQDCAERDRKWMALTISTSAALALWFVGAAVFYVAERELQGWSYFEALYFSYVCLLTIGYGDITPVSNSGKAFFVLWTLLAVPTLTILISDMGDTVVQVFSSLTVWIGKLTVLPEESGFRASAKHAAKQLPISKFNLKDLKVEQPPGFLANDTGHGHTGGDAENTKTEEYTHETVRDKIATRLAMHLQEEELNQAIEASDARNTLDRDTHFYHFILARECGELLKDLKETPSKRYSWGEWEYYIKLMSNDFDTKVTNGQYLVPKELRLPVTKKQWEKKQENHKWSWLSEKSPLMGGQTETEWLLERISTCLEKELKDSRLLPHKRKEQVPPPIGVADMARGGRLKDRTKRDSNEQSGGDDLRADLKDSVNGSDKEKRCSSGNDEDVEKQRP